MKSTLLFIFLACSCTSFAQLEAKLGARIGVATSDVNTKEVLFNTSGKNFGISLTDAKYALHAGLFLQLRVGNIIVQPEVLFVSTRNDYLLRDFSSPTIIESVRTETFQNVDIPFMLGYKWGPLRLQAGPVGQFHVSSNSDLFGIADYQDNFKDFTLSYQAGIGLDLWNVLLDFKYQGSFQDVGSHLTFGGQQIAFNTNPSQLVISAGLSFN